MPELYTRQQYELYSPENHEAWRKLYRRMTPRWERYATPTFLAGIESLCLDPDRVPRLDDVNRFLRALTGFQAKAVSGYIPAFQFFDCLRNREFPTTVTIRPLDRLDYLPEPDIFHDVAGHVPMHTDPSFADVLVRFGECAHTAAELAEGIGNERLRMERLASMVRAMARFFWFTVEFGLMRSAHGLKAYGSGLLSSHGEIQHAIESQDVQRWRFQQDWVVNQRFDINHYQSVLFIVDSFDHLYDLVGQFEKSMIEGKLDQVAGGDPVIAEADLVSFAHAERV